MGKIYKCSCGTSYNLEEGKKYKCKNCGAIMSLSTAPAVASTPNHPSKTSTGTASRPSTGSRPTPSRGAAKPGTGASRVRPGASRAAARSSGESADSSNGKKIGIGIGVAVVVIFGLVLAFSGGDSTDTTGSKGTKGANTAKGGPNAAETKPPEFTAPPRKVTPEDVGRLNAAIKKFDESKDPKVFYDLFYRFNLTLVDQLPPARKEALDAGIRKFQETQDMQALYDGLNLIPMKRLSAQDMDAVNAAIKQCEETRNPKILYDLLAKANEENWEFDRKPSHKALLRLNPQDEYVSKALGTLDRNKLNYDNWEARWKKAEANKDLNALRAEIDWVFENNLYSMDNYGLDYILVYKAILRVEPDYKKEGLSPEHKALVYEALVARSKEPYDGIIQEYKGKKLSADVFCEVKEAEWKLKKSGGRN